MEHLRTTRGIFEDGLPAEPLDPNWKTGVSPADIEGTPAATVPPRRHCYHPTHTIAGGVPDEADRVTLPKRHLRPVVGPRTGYDILSFPEKHPALHQTQSEKKVGRRVLNNSDEMRGSLAQPFTTVRKAYDSVRDPKEITRTLPAGTRNPQLTHVASSPAIHRKGNTCQVGQSCFYLF